MVPGCEILLAFDGPCGRKGDLRGNRDGLFSRFGTAIGDYRAICFDQSLLALQNGKQVGEAIRRERGVGTRSLARFFYAFGGNRVHGSGLAPRDSGTKNSAIR
jgi:hypothetical protein